MATILVGWPAIIAAAVLLIYGVATGRWKAVVAGAVVALPFLLMYLLGLPPVGYWALVPAVLNFAAALAVSRGHRGLGAAAIAPYLIVVVAVAISVLTQGHRGA